MGGGGVNIGELLGCCLLGISKIVIRIDVPQGEA